MAKLQLGGRRERRSAAAWKTEVAAWRASGLSVAEYAKAHDLHVGTLRGWAGRLRRADRAGGEQKVTAAEPSSFLPVRVSGSSKVEASPCLSVEIVLGGGRSVRLSGGLRVEQLVELLDAVEGRRGC